MALFKSSCSVHCNIQLPITVYLCSRLLLILGILSIFVNHIVFMKAYPSPGTAQAQPRERNSTAVHQPIVSNGFELCISVYDELGSFFFFFYNVVSPVLQLLRNLDFPFHTSIFPLLDNLAK